MDNDELKKIMGFDEECMDLAKRIKCNSYSLQMNNEEKQFGGINPKNGTFAKVSKDLICVGGSDGKAMLMSNKDLSLVTSLDVDDEFVRTAVSIRQRLFVLCSNNHMFEFSMKDYQRLNKLTLKNVPYSLNVLEDGS